MEGVQRGLHALAERRLRNPQFLNQFLGVSAPGITGSQGVHQGETDGEGYGDIDEADDDQPSCHFGRNLTANNGIEHPKKNQGDG